MSFEVRLCPVELCSGIQLVDRTGYFSSDAPQGYNAPGPTIPTLLDDGTFGYTTYGLEVFFGRAGGLTDTVTNGTPDFTANLLTWPHTVDPVTGYVTWEFTFEDLGLADETLRSGWWLFRTDVLFGVTDYSNDYTAGFVNDIRTKIDSILLTAELGCECEDDCEGPWVIVSKLDLTLKQGCCQQSDNFQRNIDWLLNNYQKCC